MTLPVRFDLEAEEELDAAAIYYETRRPGLARTFLDAVSEAVFRLSENPKRHTLPAGVPEELGVRRVLVRRFPYSLIYVELPDEVRVLAVAHGRKRPGYWRERIP
jgi:toxin ParE1/3/4